MATRKPSVPKTSTDLQNEIIATQQRLASLQKQLHAEELERLLKETKMVADFAQIRSRLNAHVSSLEILNVLATAVGLKRVSISMTAPVKRKPNAKKAAAK